METKRHLHTSVSPWFYIGLSIAVMLIPIPWVISWVLAATVHECFHLIGIFLTGERIESINLGLYGAKIQTEFSKTSHEVLTAAAGPLGSAILILFARWMPRVALCGFVQAIGNLMPIYPLDGGRVLSGILRDLFPHSGERITSILQIAMLMLISGIGFYIVYRYGWGLLAVLWPVALAARTGKIKIPCKQRGLRVQ